MTGHLEPLLCDNLEGYGGEGGRGHRNAYGRFMLRNGKTHHNIKKKKKKTQEKGNSTTADNELWRIFINSIMLLQHFNMFWKTGLLFSINIKYF